MPIRPHFCSTVLAGALALSAVSGVAQAANETAPALTWSAVYTADLHGIVGGARPHAGRYLDNLDLTADLDLEKAVGWSGAVLHAYVLNNSGGAPNDLAGTLQGVDNIEVATPRLRLFEFWLEQGFVDGRGSLRGGLYNLNSEFYANDAASLLINPAFGIGSELAATGPNGPSIFPSTSLGVRLNLELGRGVYARAAVLDAKAGVLGDPGGVDVSLDDGALGIVQVGVDGPTRLSVGAWRYSKKQDDQRDVDAIGAAVRRAAQGAYVLAERSVFGSEEARNGVVFVRAGLSDGDTTPFHGGWQAGLRVTKPFANRPDSDFSIGVQQGLVAGKFRDNLRDGGVDASTAESGVEITYSDRLAKRLTVQPDVQWIHNAGGDRAASDRWMVALRVKIELGGNAAE
jgi:porin